MRILPRTTPLSVQERAALAIRDCLEKGCTGKIELSVPYLYVPDEHGAVVAWCKIAATIDKGRVLNTACTTVPKPEIDQYRHLLLKTPTSDWAPFALGAHDLAAFHRDAQSAIESSFRRAGFLAPDPETCAGLGARFFAAVGQEGDFQTLTELVATAPMTHGVPLVQAGESPSFKAIARFVVTEAQSCLQALNEGRATVARPPLNGLDYKSAVPHLVRAIDAACKATDNPTLDVAHARAFLQAAGSDGRILSGLWLTRNVRPVVEKLNEAREAVGLPPWTGHDASRNLKSLQSEVAGCMPPEVDPFSNTLNVPESLYSAIEPRLRSEEDAALIALKAQYLPQVSGRDWLALCGNAGVPDENGIRSNLRLTLGARGNTPGVARLALRDCPEAASGLEILSASHDAYRGHDSIPSYLASGVLEGIIRWSHLSERPAVELRFLDLSRRASQLADLVSLKISAGDDGLPEVSASRSAPPEDWESAFPIQQTRGTGPWVGCGVPTLEQRVGLLYPILATVVPGGGVLDRAQVARLVRAHQHLGDRALVDAIARLEPPALLQLLGRGPDPLGVHREHRWGAEAERLPRAVLEAALAGVPHAPRAAPARKATGFDAARFLAERPSLRVRDLGSAEEDATALKFEELRQRRAQKKQGRAQLKRRGSERAVEEDKKRRRADKS